MTTAYDWTGRIGDVWADEWRRTDRSFAALTHHLNAAILAAAAPDTRTILDIGCGAGETALAIAQARPDAQVTGVDLSPNLVALAKTRAALSPNAQFICADATVAAADHAPVDLYASRHGVMFFHDPIAAFTAFWAAAAPGAAFVFSSFAERTANPWATETIGGTVSDPGAPTPGPFAFADPAHVASILAASGWYAEEPRRVAFAYRAGAGVDPVADAVDYFRRIGPAASLIRDASPDDRACHVARLTQVCENHRDGAVVDFPAAAWIWTARKPAAAQGDPRS